MRTTLTLDDDLAAILQRESQLKGLSFKQVVNATLRRGLHADSGRTRSPRVVTRPHAFGFKAGVDLDRLNQLADELEAEAFASKHQAPR